VLALARSLRALRSGRAASGKAWADGQCCWLLALAECRLLIAFAIALLESLVCDL
jgi:hypothetical protein